MSGMKDYMKGYQSGYSTGPSTPPRTFAESVGHSAGQAQRRREMQPSGEDPAREVAAGPGALLAVRAMLLLCGIGAIGLLLFMPSGPVKKLLVLVGAVVALTLTRAVRRAIGPITPVYAGLVIGLIIGCLELIATGGQLNLYNLAIFLFLGAAIGAIGIPIAIARRKKR